MSDAFSSCTSPFPRVEDELPDKRYDIFLHILLQYTTPRWFNCLGEARLNGKLSEDGLYKSDEGFINNDLEEMAGAFFSYRAKMALYRITFDKGATFLLTLDELFEDAQRDLVLLNCQMVPTLGTGFTESNRGMNNASEQRKKLVNFFMLIRAYLLEMVLSLETNTETMAKRISHKMAKHLKKFRTVISRHALNLPEFAWNRTARSRVTSSMASNDMAQPPHQVFHCHLEVRWFHLSTLLLLYRMNYIIKRGNRSDAGKKIPNDPMELDYEDDGDFDNGVILDAVNLLVCDLVHLAILRFVELGPKEAMKLSAFKCSCVQELWMLLHALSCTLEKSDCDTNSQNGCRISFWTFVNDVFLKVCDDFSSLFVSSAESDNCSSPNVFNLWLLKSLSCSLSSLNIEIKGNTVNVKILEKILKNELKDECCEAKLRLILPAVHFLIIDLWEPHNEAILILWEYYQRKLNTSFYLAGETLENLCMIPKTSDKLLEQVRDRLEDNARKMGSFQQFLRLLGLHLRRTNRDNKFWNQIKGRIYSKFPASKMIVLTDLGVYNFVSLFLTIAVVKDSEISEICKKLQVFLELTNRNDRSVRDLVFVTHVAILELLARNQIDFSDCAAPLVKFISTLDLRKPENVSLISRVGCLFTSDKMQLGLHKLVGDWIHRYLLTKRQDGDPRFLICNLNNLLVEMKANTYNSLDSQDVETFEALWKQIKTVITLLYFRPEPSDYKCLGTLCANFAILSTKIYKSATMLRDVVNVISSSTTLSAKTFGEFLTTLIDYKPLPMALKEHDTFIMNAWIRCELFNWRSMSVTNDNLFKYVTSLPDNKCINFKLVNNEPLISFCRSLNQHYTSVKDVELKKEIYVKVSSYFNSLNHWLEPVLKEPYDVDLLKRVFFMVGSIVDSAGVFLYEMGQSDCVLQGVIDVMLLPLSIRRPGYRLQEPMLLAVNESLNLFLEGMDKIKEENDSHLMKVIQDLVAIYLPQCVTLDRRCELPSPFSLTKCFRPDYEEAASRSKRVSLLTIILVTINNRLLKPRVREPSQECRKAIKFLHAVLVAYKFHRTLLIAMLKQCVLDHLCWIMMYAEGTSAGRREASNLMLAIFDCNAIRTDQQLGEAVMDLFYRQCEENLAFSSRQVFEMLQVLSSTGPDLVYRFLPSLKTCVLEIEIKRQVKFDRVLRAELENICKLLGYKQY